MGLFKQAGGHQGHCQSALVTDLGCLFSGCAPVKVHLGKIGRMDVFSPFGDIFQDFCVLIDDRHNAWFIFSPVYSHTPGVFYSLPQFSSQCGAHQWIEHVSVGFPFIYKCILFFAMQ